MKASRESILSKTNYGINIYAYVLRQYYPGTTVLSLSGRACSQAKNPFREDKNSLMVAIDNGVAMHTDANDPTFTGDAFDFAQLHFKQEGQDLLTAIDKAMNLDIENPTSLYKNQTDNIIKTKENLRENIKMPQFSFFQRPISNTTPKRTVTLAELYHLIIGDKYAEATHHLREIEDNKQARAYKALNFDYATLSGTFSKRNDKSLLAHSGLITIDFDHLPDCAALRAALLEDKYFDTELIFTSPSGDGLKWVIPIDLSLDTHLNYFKAIANYIKQSYHVDIDQSGKDISRACFIPNDKDAFINPKYLQ